MLPGIEQGYCLTARDGEEKFDIICQLAKQYGAALVIGSIDEDKEASMARTADRKLAIAERAHGLELGKVAAAGCRPAGAETDELTIFVWRNPELGAKVQVRPDGRITTPLITDMPAVGKTLKKGEVAGLVARVAELLALVARLNADNALPGEKVQAADGYAYNIAVQRFNAEIPLGDLESALPICNSCVAPHTFRPDED